MEQKKKNNTLVVGIIGCAALAVVGIPIIGILAAIAIPSFLRYTQRAKMTEAQTNVRTIAYNVADKFAADCAFPENAGPLNARKDLCEGLQVERSPAAPGYPVFTSLGFDTKQAYRYTYRTVRGPEFYRVIAEGDLDCDGVLSRFEITIDGDASCLANVGPLQEIDPFE